MIEDYENPDRSFVWPGSAPVELDEANVNPNREDPFEENPMNSHFYILSQTRPFI